MFSTYPPPEELAPYVAFFYDFTWRSEDYENGIEEFILPSGKGFMVFQHKGRFRGKWNDNEVPVPDHYILGQQTKTYTLFTDYDSMGVTGVAFHPTGLYKLFGRHMSTMKNILTPTEEVIQKGYGEFALRFKELERPEQRISLVTELLSNQVEFGKPEETVIDIAIKEMESHLGCRPIKKILASIKMSPRYFQKKFNEHVGVSPSTYNRIIRFTNLLAETNPKDVQNYKEISALYNYYDFSHFYRDFKKYCGIPPSAFHIEKFKFIKEAFVDNPIFLPQS